MPVQATERERIYASILKSRTLIYETQCLVHETLCDLHERVLRSREAISQSLDAIAKADAVLARRSFADGAALDAAWDVAELPSTRTA